jgi:arylsulfatase A-like enzyme
VSAVRSSGTSGWIGRTVVLAVWFGLAAGLVEVALFGVKRIMLDRIIRVSRDVIWMAPLADVFFCLVAAGLLVLLALRFEKLRSLQAAVTATAFPAVLTVILHYHPIHVAAKAVLALGIAVALGRAAAAVPRLAGALVGWTSLSFRRMSGDDSAASDLPAVDRRRFVLASVATLGGLAAGTRGFLRVREWNALRSLPPADPASPNVLLIVLDTVRARSLSLHGYERDTTPELQRWAARAVTFDNAYAIAPWTLPSHAAMFTGRWHHEMSADWDDPLDDALPTLAEHLSDRGYATIAFTANPAYTTWETGLDRGFARYDDFPQSPTQMVGSSSLGILLGCGTRNEAGCRLREPLGWYELLGRRPADEVRTEFTRWLGRRDGERPFFAFLNFFDAHAPYLPPREFAERFGRDLPRGNPMHLDLPGWEWTPDQVRAEQDAYDGAIAFMDSQVGALLDDLDSRGILDDAIVIVTSDHGEEFMEHGIMTHANSLYSPSLHVPLMVIGGSRVPRGARVDTEVSVRDIASTVTDLTGGGTNVFPGTSLVEHWGDAPPAAEPIHAKVSGRTFRPEHYPVSRGDLHSVIEGSHHYIRRGDGVTELYDLRADPWERSDLLGAAAGDTVDRSRMLADSLRFLIDRIMGVPE